MSDAREDVKEAVRQNRLLLAKLQVREDALVQEIDALTAERATATGELHEALGAKIDELGQERAALALQREKVVGELGALDKLAGKLPVMEAQALAREALAFTGADPDAAPPSMGRMSEDEARAQLAALKSQRGGAEVPKSTEVESPPEDATPPKRVL